MQLHKALLYASDEMVNTVVKRTWQQLVSLTGATRSEALIKVHQNPRGGQTLRPLVCVGLPDCEFVVSSAADLYHQMLKANTPKFIDELRITHGDFLGDRLSGISAGLFTTANDYQYLFGPILRPVVHVARGRPVRTASLRRHPNQHPANAKRTNWWQEMSSGYCRRNATSRCAAAGCLSHAVMEGVGPSSVALADLLIA
jgi:hypothetical protein